MNTTVLTSGSDDANASTYTTAEVTLTAGRFYTMGVVNHDSASEQALTSIITTGGAISFASHASVVFNTIASNARRLNVWTVLAGSTVTATIVITPNDAGTGCQWFLTESDTPHATTPLPQAAATNAGDATTSIAATLGALAATSSHQIAFYNENNSTPDPTLSGTDWAFLGNFITGSAPASGLRCALNTAGAATQVTFSHAAGRDEAVIVVEVAAAASSNDIEVTLTKGTIVFDFGTVTASGAEDDPAGDTTTPGYGFNLARKLRQWRNWKPRGGRYN